MLKKTLELEANRCLGCRNARCQNNCPIHTPISEVINLFKEGKLDEAGEMLFENNPLSIVCSIVCPHERQCYGNCIKGIKDTPVEFYKIEEYISKEYLINNKFNKQEKIDKKIAIVGSGPAGLTVAFKLAMKGYDITIFEANSKIGGVLRYGIPDFRLENTIVDLIEERLLNLGVKIKYNTSVLDDVKVENLLNDGYESVFLGIGLTKAKSMNLKGETLGNVHYAIDYLKSPESFDLGKKVSIIGAGNVAMDAARTVRKMGADTTVYYRRGFEDMTAVLAEINEAKEEGVKFEVFKTPIDINEKGMTIMSTEKVVDGDRVRIVNVEGSEKFVENTAVVIAISQEAKEYSNTELKFNEYGLLDVDEEGQTSINGIFAAGDIVSGARTVVEAVNMSKKVAESIDNYLKSI